uniref:SAM domain-containing protein n=1 Tax=Takifugu rubripes TaxID=31033 RepID=A0A674MNL8_TAKRU
PSFHAIDFSERALVTAAAAAPCQGACAGRCRARDASMIRTGMVSLSPALLQQLLLPESVTWVFHLCLCAHPAYSPDSGECKRPAGKDPSSWGVEEVVSFIKDADPQALGPHTDAFRKHEIDGDALLLLKSEMMMKYLGLKLGPALKLSYHIDKLKQSWP